VQKLSYLVDSDDTAKAEVVIVPPFTALRSVQTLIDSDKLPFGLGAQDVYPEDKGAFTGEISPPMLVALKTEYVIVGHSERRQLFGEDDLMVNKKVRAVLAHEMTPIVCVGETLEERDADGTESKVTQQVRRAYDNVTADQAATTVIAYEPIWAIGTGRTATPEQAQEACGFIRDVLRARGAGAERVRVLYGGSVKPGNAAELLSLPDVDGALVGGASLDPEDFAAIVEAAG
ncbi:MAG TPA: triose-phosphate isomerase, partial [Solirubrobacterales bacterium]|nr:triose-phosphate isomerase [Solirubrobacterales bacterium]